MMYRESYVLSVLLDGKILPEENGAVLLPFGAEYKLRLRNKSRVRSVADVHINGDPAVTGIVVDANDSIDLERFVDGYSLNGGPRFKLAKLSDSGVSQPGDSQNGLVEVRYYAEVQPPEVKTVEHHTYHDHHPCFDYYCQRCHPHRRPYWPDVTFTSFSDSSITRSGGTKGISGSGSGKFRSESMSRSKESLSTRDLGVQFDNSPARPISDYTGLESEAASTVKGSESSQSFRNVHIDVDKSSNVALSLKLRGVSGVIDSCCGKKRKTPFCSKCGKKLVLA